MKPLLAGEADLDKLNFPVVVSPKLDGVRALVHNGELLSRSLKKIPNKFIQSQLALPELEGVDGELIIGPPNANDTYNKTVSGVMRHEGEPNYKFYVFDFHNLNPLPFSERYKRLHIVVEEFPNIHMVPHVVASDLDQLLKMEQTLLEKGYEGLMIRDPEGLYKYGRSTQREGILLKLKRFSDSEAIIIGFEERMHNANELKKNELGYADRSHSKSGMVPTDSLGALIVSDKGVEFNIGTGFTEEQRQTYWRKKDKLLGQLVKYKYFSVGVKDAPRHPTFVGFRSELDL